MILQELRLANFRSFTKEQSFRLDNPPGLYYMTGRNEVEPELEANGSGKSSVWEALCWVLFGKTTRMLKAGEVGNWAAGQNCRVSLAFKEQEQSYVIRRSWSPNELTSVLEARDLVQEDVERMIGTSFTPFLHSILIGQFVPMFLDLGPADKAALFSDVLQLDRWIEFSDRASQTAKRHDADINILDLELSRLGGQIQELEVEDLQPQIDAWEAQRKQRIQEVEGQYKVLVKKKTSLSPKIVVLLESATRNREQARILLHTSEEQRARVTDFRQHAEAARAKAARLEAKIEEARQTRKYFNEQSQCILCMQVIPHEHKEGQLRRLLSNMATMTTEQEEANRELKAAIERGEATERESRRLRDEANALTSSSYSQENELNTLRQEAEQVNKDLDRLETEVDRIEKEENPHIKRKKELADRSRDLKLKRGGLQAQRSDKARKATAVAYWVKGFKELRLFLISEALTQLEVEVNSVLSSLGMMDWKIRFAVEADTKSGTVRRGFSVFIQSPHNDTAVPWEAWSGGESQRLRLAATLGLSNLILNNQGITPNLEVWDEPSTWLSQAGVDDLLETLYHRAHVLKKQIWVVDHRSLEFGGFSRTITVVKDRNGSYIEQ